MKNSQTNTENNIKPKLVFVDSKSETLSLEGKAQKVWHEVQNGKVPGVAVMWDDIALGASGILAQNPARVAGAGLSLFSGYQLKKSANGEDVFPKKLKEKAPVLQKVEDLFRKRPWECSRGMSMAVSTLFLTAGIITESMNPELSGFTEIAKASLTNPEVWYGAYGIFAKSFALLREDEAPKTTTTETNKENAPSLNVTAESSEENSKKKGRLRKVWNTVKKNGLKISSIVLTPNIILRAKTGASEIARHAGDPTKYASGITYMASVVPYGIFLATKWFSDKKVAGMNFEGAMNKKEEEGKIIRIDQNGMEAALTAAGVSEERQAKITKAFEKSGNYKPVESVLVRHLEKDELFKALDTARQNGGRAAA